MSSGNPKLDDLQKLLEAKRREPMPRDFLARLPKAVREHLHDPESPETMSWLQRLGVHFDLSPAIVGAVGLLVCALLAGGIAFALRAERPRPAVPLEPLDVNGLALGQPPLPNPSAKPASPVAAPAQASTQPVTVTDVPGGELLAPPPKLPPAPAPADK